MGNVSFASSFTRFVDCCPHLGGPEMIGPLSGKGPLYKQVYSAIREAILSGKMPSGSMLPPTRELVQVLHISRTTILIAYAELVAEGYATARVGSGTYVSENLPDGKLQSSTSISCKLIMQSVDRNKVYQSLG